MNYYNEFDPKAAAWIQELINQKLIPPGIVDTRSITDVRADDLREFTQCHFFAGIAGWSFALQLAGVDPDEPLWTGSCPCQSFSSAGKQKGFDDARDLWPVFFNLIRECKPPKVIGEQVASAIKFGWLDRVYTDLESAGYACGSAVIGAHSVGAPHMRQRLYWGAERVSDCNSKRLEQQSISEEWRQDLLETSGCSDVDGLSDTARGQCEQSIRTQGNVFQRSANDLPDCRMAENANGGGCGGRCDGDSGGQGRQVQAPGLCTCGGIPAVALGDGCGERLERVDEGIEPRTGETPTAGQCGAGNIPVGNSESDNERRNTLPGIDGERLQTGRSGGDGNLDESESLRLQESGNQSARPLEASSGNDNLSSLPWSRYALVYCRDNKIRRVPAESVLQRVADGISGEMDISRADSGFPLCQTASFEKGQIAVLLRGYGNAINPYTAAEFIKAFNHKGRK